MARRDTDPLGNFNFQIEISGVTIADFAEVTGLSLETEVIEYRHGADSVVRKVPGLHRAGDITLKRGSTGTKALWDWYKSVLSGTFDRKDMSIVLLDETHTEVMRWNLFEAWPRKYVAPALDGLGNSAAIEEIVIVSERIELA